MNARAADSSSSPRQDDDMHAVDAAVRQSIAMRSKQARRERRSADRRSNNARVRNTYLKLILEGDAPGELHDLVRRVGDRWSEASSEGDEECRSTAAAAVVSKKQAKRRLVIKPRSRDTLHMTYFFAGRALQAMPREELENWEGRVRECVAGMSTRSSNVGDYRLRFKSLEVFPPGRQNLIVAVFEPSSALVDLRDELCRIALMEKEDSGEGDAPDEGKGYEFTLLRDLTLKQKRMRRRGSPSWIAHVTLGNLVGGTRGDVQRLSEWLSERNLTEDIATMNANGVQLGSGGSLSPRECSKHILECDIDVIGLTLGGPVPEHATDIDWNFPLR